jgi:hypothetical protein
MQIKLIPNLYKKVKITIKISATIKIVVEIKISINLIEIISKGESKINMNNNKIIWANIITRDMV